ncbi:MAG TPA: M28 family peptidase [Steroidobacteraceae bacterium]|nr:M28 family peptidase [Steroidobacteraceae bacterium]
MKAGISGLVALMLIAAAAWLAIALQEPPSPGGGELPAKDFSARRAMLDVRAIAERPHPIGSADHARVREHIVGRLRALGLEPQLQETTAVFARDGVAGRVTNILARLKGTASTQAVLLCAHYDSVPSGPGAGDDASGVAVLLETVRALRARPALRNDVIVLVTDGEEVGLLGAAAFTAEHPWARDVGLALNFEARGNRGPALMFETTADNARWIELMRDRVADPRSSSLTQAVYRRMPNDTDLTVFKAAGLAGLNFAFIGNLPAYHTRLDTPENLSTATLEQQGNYALAIARGAGNAKLPWAGEGDATYFNTLGSQLVVYPEAWVIALTIGTALLTLAVVILAFRRGQLSIRSFLLSLLVPPACVAVTSGLAFVMLGAARWMHRTLVPPGPILTSNWYAAAIVAIAVTVAMTLIALLRRAASATALSVGALVWWTAFAGLTSVYLPGGNFLFLWPAVLLALAVLTGLRWAPGTAPGFAAQILSLLFLLLAVLLIAPVGYSFHDAFPLHAVGTIVLGTLTSIALVLIADPLYRTVAAFGWHAAGVAAAAVAVLFSGGLIFTRYSAEQPQVSNLFYLLDADAGRAFWATRESTANVWTTEILTAAPERGPMPEFFSADTGTLLRHEAPIADLAAPVVEVVSDTAKGDRRLLQINIRAGQPAWELRLRLSGAAVISATIDDRRLDWPPAMKARGSDAAGDEWSLRYFNPGPGGIRLALELPATKAVTLRTTAYLLGLPTLASGAAPPRPAHLMPNHEGDLTLIARATKMPAAAN